LDEFAEFAVPSLQALRKPMEQGRLVVMRAGGGPGEPDDLAQAVQALREHALAEVQAHVVGTAPRGLTGSPWAACWPLKPLLRPEARAFSMSSFGAAISISGECLRTVKAGAPGKGWEGERPGRLTLFRIDSGSACQTGWTSPR
jgi:hypothetical protein